MAPGLVLLEFQARIHGLNVSLGQIRMGQLLALAVTSAAIILLFLLAYHMGSRDSSDPLDFDYLLKPGVTTEANAIEIARMAGVPV